MLTKINTQTIFLSPLNCFHNLVSPPFFKLIKLCQLNYEKKSNKSINSFYDPATQDIWVAPALLAWGASQYDILWLSREVFHDIPPPQAVYRSLSFFDPTLQETAQQWAYQ